MTKSKKETMQRKKFEKLVREAIRDLPEKIRQKMDNVEIVVEKGSPNGPFLGLYQGVPKTTWGRGFGGNLPDKITIFQESIEKLSSKPEEIKELVKNTVWHEIAHHFGFDERGVRKLEPKWRKRKSL